MRIKIAAFIVALVVLIFLCGCDRGGSGIVTGVGYSEGQQQGTAPPESEGQQPDTTPPESEGQQPDTTPPEVVSTHPADGAQDVPVDVVITVTFDEQMDPESIACWSIRLLDADTGIPVVGRVSYSEEDQTATLRPEKFLSYDRAYILQVISKVRDLAGNAMGSSYEVLFHTLAFTEAEITAYSSRELKQEHFGRSVSMSGDYIVAGNHVRNNGAGMAHVFKNDGNDNFTWIADLAADDAADLDRFGWSVAASGDYIAVGAPDKSDRAGAVYIYRNDGSDSFQQVARLVAKDAAAGDRFGYSLSMSGDYVVVGAPIKDTPAATAAGAVYVFRNDGAGNFAQTAKLTASDAEEGDGFGISVFVNGDYVVVGAPYKDGPAGSDAGAAYVYVNDGTGNFIPVAKLVPDDSAAYDHFGFSVYTNGDYVLAGAPGRDVGTEACAGAVYVFKNSGDNDFALETVLEGVTAGEGLGSSVFMEEGKIYAGAEGFWCWSGIVIVFGKVYQEEKDRSYRNGEFARIEDLGGGNQGDRSGASVVAVGAYVAIGAPGACFDRHWPWGGGGRVRIYKHQGGSVFTGIGELKAPVEGGTPELQSENFFGFSLAGDADRVFVGEPGESGGGVVHIFRNVEGEFVRTAMFTADSVTLGDEFGRSLSVAGDYVAVGAPFKDSAVYRSGAVYIFKNSGGDDFVEVAELEDDEPENDEHFGSCVAMDGDYVVVGALYKDGPGRMDAGAVYVFKNDGNDNFVRVAKITLGDEAARGDLFGSSVAMEGDYIVVGARGREAAYVYKNDGSDDFVQIAELAAYDVEEGDLFGYSVSIDDVYVAVGAIQKNESGAVYIFRRSALDRFIHVATLTADDASKGDQFGSSVFIDGARIIVGAQGKFMIDAAGQKMIDAGAAYIFELLWGDSFMQIARLRASDARGGWYVAGDYFGYSVGVSGGRFIVGAPYKSMDTRWGSVYIYEIE